MLNILCGLLLRFWLNTIALAADIEKAILQIGLQQNQRDVTRFLWLKDYTRARVDKDNIQEKRFCHEPFGVISSPFLLGATIENHLDMGVHLLQKSKMTYMLNVYQSAKSISKEASMNLREWSSNDKQVNQFIELDDRAIRDSVNVLGYIWCVESDIISLKKANSTLDSQILIK